MMTQLVDPFVPARPRPSHSARTAAVRPVSRPQPPAPRPAHSGISIDGVLPAKAAAPAHTHAHSRPHPHSGSGYRPPAGPLHLQYMSKPAAPQPAQPPQPQPQPQPIAPAVSAPAARQKQKFSWDKQEVEPKKVSTLALVGVVAIASLALFSVQIGQAALAVYAIVALWRRWPSQQTFALALAMFGGIIITQLIEPLQEVSNNLAVYAFLLLCIGVIALAREVRRDSRDAAFD